MKSFYIHIRLINILLVGIIFGQYYQIYGKNIVQYNDFDWNYIQTQHFDIYTYSPGDDHADLVAKESEEAYQKLSQLLDWRLKNRVSIIIYNSHNDFQQTNVVKQYMQEGIGGVTELYKNRVVIPFDGSLIEFRDVLHHELLHAFINDCVYGGSLRKKITNSVQYNIPHWMNEGLAEYSANHWDANSDMWMRDIAVNSDQILNINQLGGYLGYRGGQSVWKFITSKWGDEAVAEIIFQIKKNKNVNAGFKEAIGLDLKSLNEQWKQYVKETYWGEIGVRKNLNEFSRQLTNHEKWGNSYNIAPSISPNGGKIAILSNKDGPMSIYLISADNGKVIKKIITGERNSEYEELHILKPGITWSPDGKHIAFSAKSGNSDALYIIDANTYDKEKIRLDNIEGLFRPIWSPVDDKIAFIGNNGKSSDIYIYDIKSKKLSSVTNDWYSEDHVSWFPDGKRLIFISDRGDNLTSNSREEYFERQFDIYSISLENKDILRLTDTPYNESYPVISSDNQTIAYISDQSGINNIYLTDNNFKNSYPITNVMTGITQLSWNGDDTQLIFTGFYKMGYDIFTLSNPKDLMGSIDIIQPAKWKLESNQINLSKKEYITEPQESIEDKYKNYILTDKISNNNGLESNDNDAKDESKQSFKDSDNNYIVNRYTPRFTLDYANYGVGYNYMVGNQVMANFIFSDILGDYNFYISTETVLTLNSSDYYFVFNNLKNKIDKTYYLYQDVREQLYLINYNEQYLRRLRENGLLINFSYPFSKFSRLEYGFNINYMEQNKITQDCSGWTGICDEEVEVELAQTSLEPNIKYVSDHIYFQNNSIAGYRGSIEYIYSYKALTSNNSGPSSFNRIMIDSRYYKPLFNGVTFAFRFYGGSTWNWNQQPVSEQNKFYLGGSPCIDAWDCNTSIPFTMMFDEESIMPLRGVGVYSKSGDNVMLYNFELRLPFLIYYFPAIQFLGQINGAIFCDIGTTWNGTDYQKFSDKNSWWNGQDYISDGIQSHPDIPSAGWAMSYGFGPRFIFLGLPWQIDFTWEYNPHVGTITDRKTFLRIFPEF